tara:strand:+ start:2480 stop:2851 length:372 start_codon:yes stop_codon:yes gene_type:complete
MQVNFSFDSEKEDVGELKKLYSWLGELIAKRDGAPAQPVQAPAQSAPITSKLNPNDGGASGGWPSRYSEPNLGKPAEEPVQQSAPEPEKKEEKKKPSRTAGGCRVVEYSPEFENMVSNLFGRR